MAPNRYVTGAERARSGNGKLTIAGLGRGAAVQEALSGGLSGLSAAKRGMGSMLGFPVKKRDLDQGKPRGR